MKFSHKFSGHAKGLKHTLAGCRQKETSQGIQPKGGASGLVLKIIFVVIVYVLLKDSVSKKKQYREYKP
jgi:hypothetical protein